MADGEFDNLTVNNVLTIGADTNLYRSAANVLKTDDDFEVNGLKLNTTRIARQASDSYLEVYGGYDFTVGSGFTLYGKDHANAGQLRVLFGHTQNVRFISRNFAAETTQDVMFLTGVGQLQLSITGSSGGLLIGGDAHLYRGAGNVLQTDDTIRIAQDWMYFDREGSSVSQPAFHGWVTGDSVGRFVIYCDGKIEWGSGSATRDTSLYRSAANTLATNNIIESREYWQHLNPQQFMDALYNHTFTDTTGKIKFYDLNAGNNYILLHGVMSDGNPNLVCSQHLAVEKDLVVKGMLDSLEGAVALNGGSYSPEWGPYTRNPFIWLANANYYTLEIRKKVAEGEGDWSYNHQYGQVWGWGDLACGTIKSAGSLYLTGNTNGYLWNNGGYIRQSGGYGFVADGYLVVGTLSSGSSGPLYIDGYHRISYYGSSIRHKENVETAEDASWIYNLRPVNFDWKDQNRAKEEGRQLGLIAEEVNALCPQLTWLDSEGRPEGVHYEWLGVPLLIEVKKLHKRVEALENQLKQNPTAA